MGENKFGDVDSTDIIVIKDGNTGKYLEIIAKKGTFMDSVKLQFVSSYQNTAEGLLYLLEKSFGWQEINRERRKVVTKSGYELVVWVIDVEKLGAIKGL